MYTLRDFLIKGLLQLYLLFFHDTSSRPSNLAMVSARKFLSIILTQISHNKKLVHQWNNHSVMVKSNRIKRYLPWTRKRLTRNPRCRIPLKVPDCHKNSSSSKHKTKLFMSEACHRPECNWPAIPNHWKISIAWIEQLEESPTTFRKETITGQPEWPEDWHTTPWPNPTKFCTLALIPGSIAQGALVKLSHVVRFELKC